MKKLASSGRDQPPQKQEARAHSNKALKEAIISGCLSQSRAQAARFPELLSLPLAVGKIKFLEKSERAGTKGVGITYQPGAFGMGLGEVRGHEGGDRGDLYKMAL